MQEPYDVQNDFLNLPDDSEHGFAILQQRQYAKLEESWDLQNQGWNPERNYVETLVIYDRVNGLGLLSDFHDIPHSDTEFSEFFSKFRFHASFTSKRLLAEYARRVKLTEVSVLELDQSAKDAIRSFVTSIREKLANLSINENKMSSLMKKLSAFELELDLTRTRTEAFYQFVIEASRAGREENEEIQPILKSAERVFSLFDKAKKAFVAFPPWKETKKITGPNEHVSNSTDDQDIPF